MITFSLIHATARPPSRRGLPRFYYPEDVRRWQEWGWCAAAQAWMDRAAIPRQLEYIVVIDYDSEWEPNLADLLLSRDRDPGALYWMASTGPRNCISAWNAGAKASIGQVLVVVADDVFPPEHWDTELLAAIANAQELSEPDLTREFVVEVSSGTIQDANRNIVHAILSRRRYERYGYIYYPKYESMCADPDFTLFARRDGVVLDARHLVFQHAHPITGLSKWDDCYRVSNHAMRYEQGKTVYQRREEEAKQNA